MAYLQVEQFCKTTSQGKLQDISFSLAQRDNLVLIGDSNLLLRGILGLYSPERGQIIWKSPHYLGELGVVLSDCFYPEGKTPKQMGRLFSMLYSHWQGELFRQYCQDLNLSPQAPLVQEAERFRCALAVALSRKPSFLLYAPLNLEKIKENQPVYAQWQESLSHCHRILAREKCGKILCVPNLDAVPSWDSVSHVGILREGRLLIFEEISGIEENYACISCSHQEIHHISPADYVSQKQEGTGFRLLLRDKVQFSQKYPNFHPNRLSLQEIVDFLREEAVL